MFPRYLFIHLDTTTDNWAPIRSTFGVSTLVRFGMMPSPVPDDLIGILRKRDDSTGIQDIPMHEFRKGQKVSVEEGPFTGYEGIYLAETSRQRVLVLLDIVGKAAKIRIGMDALSPVEE